MVEGTESCDINWGKHANQSKVHKIRKTNFVNLYHNCRDLKISEECEDGLHKETVARSCLTVRQQRNFACKTARWGRVMFFFINKNIFIDLITHKSTSFIQIKYILHSKSK
jgi:hypothetical protein